MYFYEKPSWIVFVTINKSKDNTLIAGDGKVYLNFLLLFCVEIKSVYVCNRFLREKQFFKVFKFKIFF
jgi:hypothetical protein